VTDTFNDTRPTIDTLQEALEDLKRDRRDLVNELAGGGVEEIISDSETDRLVRLHLVIGALKAVIKERRRGDDFGEEIPES
jgi:hypothetical protein